MTIRKDASFILYDGECPFCSSFVNLARVREVVNEMRLLNAREHPELVAFYRSEGMEINDGMIVSVAGSIFYGAEAVRVLSELTGSKGLFRILLQISFSGTARAKFLYPLLVFGRRLWFRITFKKMI